MHVSASDLQQSRYYPTRKWLMPSKMNNRNELIGRTEHLPRGYYWRCYTDYYLNALKVDVRVISQEEFDKKEKAAGQSDQLPS
ncbi:hypothetical protein J28TS4_16990 [Paenibacillus lautus]|nr:hypothetical protein J28TS4_16990 [Paenibacillus lautus]